MLLTGISILFCFLYCIQFLRFPGKKVDQYNYMYVAYHYGTCISFLSRKTFYSRFTDTCSSLNPRTGLRLVR